MSKANNRAAADTFWLSLLAFLKKVITFANRKRQRKSN